MQIQSAVYMPVLKHKISWVKLHRQQCLLHTSIFLVCSLATNTYLLTPRCRALLEKLNGLQLVEKFPTFHRTPRFITTLTSMRHLSLSWASPIQSNPTSTTNNILLSILYLNLLSVFPLKIKQFPLSLFKPNVTSKTVFLFFYSSWLLSLFSQVLFY